MCDSCYQVGPREFVCSSCINNGENPDHGALLAEVDGLEPLFLDDLTGRELCRDCGQCIKEEIAFYLGCVGHEFSDADDYGDDYDY